MELRKVTFCFVLITTLFSCSNKNGFPDSYRGPWNIVNLKHSSTYIVGGTTNGLSSGDKLYILKNRDKFLISFRNGSRVEGDFKIEKNDFFIYNASDPFYDGIYTIAIDTMHHGNMSTHLRMILRSEKMSLSAKMIQV